MTPTTDSTTGTTPDFTIDELAIPTTLDDPSGDDFARAIELINAVDAVTYGTPDLAFEPAEELPFFTDPFRPHRLLVARQLGRIVALATLETQDEEDADTAWISVLVLPDARGRGIGRALADEIENIVAETGRSKAVVYHGVQAAEGEQLPSPTGFGAVPVSAPAVRFLLARGYRLEQVERLSRLALPVAGLDDLLANAQAASGPEYLVHTWTGPTPERWQADLAVLRTRMSTDAPSAGLEEPEDLWTVDRVISWDKSASDSPRTRLVAAVEHVPSGHLVGFTVLSVPAQRARSVTQFATLVLREHRGHRLGMLLKVANLAHLERFAPGHPSVTTFNAEENRHMLDVNEAVGFVGIALEGAWRKDMEELR